jgi:hypothetical protein
MSGSATFTQPAAPTQGLQSYNLDRKAKRLYPATAFLDFKRMRASKAKRRTLDSGRNARMEKTEMADTIQKMVETLSKSVTGIYGAGLAPDDLNFTLEKSFGEFHAALDGEITIMTAAHLAKAAPVLADPGADLLFKGLGTVGRVAGLVSQIAGQVANIKVGKEWSGQTPDVNATPDLPSAEVSMFLDHCLAFAELAMRSAVNEHVDFDPDSDGDDDGSQMMVIKSADGTDQRVKTALVPELAKYATDDALLAATALDLSAAMMADMGIPEASLTKMFEFGDLAKAVPSATDPGAAPNTDAGADPAADPGADQGGEDMMAQMQVLGRLQAAAMIQLDGIMRAFGGGDGSADPNADDPNADLTTEGDGAAAPDPAAPDPVVKKPPFGKFAPDGELTKAAPMNPAIADLLQTVKDLTTTVSAQGAQLAKVLKLPEPARAILGAEGFLSKTADIAVETDAAAEIAVVTALEKMDGNTRAAALIKMAHGVPLARIR